MENRNVKKSLMYLSGEDFYYFSYSILLILNFLGCKNGKYFRDYRKLPFLIDLINDENILFIIESSLETENEDAMKDPMDSSIVQKRNFNKLDTEYLFRSYSSGIARRSEMLKLLFTLEKSGFVKLRKGEAQASVDVSLLTKNVPKAFFDKKLFEREYKNMDRLKSLIKRLPILSLGTLLDRVYEAQGVKTWAL
jgi:hypothetical protein